MNKKIIIIGVAILVGIIGLLFWGQNIQRDDVLQNTNTESLLTASETLYDFGTISMKDGLVNHTFKVTNLSDKEVEIKRIYTSCMCTNAYLETINGEEGPFGMEGMGYIPPANEIIGVKESRDIKVVYDPNAHGPAGVGRIDRIVYLTDEFGGVLQFEIKAIVTP